MMLNGGEITRAHHLGQHGGAVHGAHRRARTRASDGIPAVTTEAAANTSAPRPTSHGFTARRSGSIRIAISSSSCSRTVCRGRARRPSKVIADVRADVADAAALQSVTPRAI